MVSDSKLQWNPETGDAKVPISEAEYELITLACEALGVSSEWFAREIFRAALWHFGEKMKFLAGYWAENSKDLPKPVFRFTGNLELKASTGVNPRE